MELKDLPKPISRKDIYKYAICNGLIDNLPKPLSRQDFYLMALINGDTEDLSKPISRLDIIMYNCIMGTMENLPKPISRADYYWTAICTGLKNNIPEPISRSDYYDYYLALYSAFREWLEYRGETIQAECSRQAYIKDLKLEGNTVKENENVESCGSKEGKINLSVNSNIVEIPMELKGLPNGIKDTIEKINNVWSYVKRVDKIVLDGSEDWVRDQNKNGYTRFSIAFTLATCSTDENYAICDKYNLRHKTDLTYNDTENLLIRDDMSKLYLKVVDSTDSITVTKFKESLSNNPVTVYYQLAEPVITPLSQELQDKLDSLQVAKGSNTITTNNNVKANIECNLPV